MSPSTFDDILRVIDALQWPMQGKWPNRGYWRPGGKGAIIPPVDSNEEAKGIFRKLKEIRPYLRRTTSTGGSLHKKENVRFKAGGFLLQKKDFGGTQSTTDPELFWGPLISSCLTGDRSHGEQCSNAFSNRQRCRC